jgi:adenosylcobyric acid synthase
MEPEKTVRNVEAQSLQFDLPLKGYEIHLGRTTGPDCERPTVRVNGTADGAASRDGKVFGSYLHGLFVDDGFRAAFLQSMGIAADALDYRAGVDQALDSIAGQLSEVLDIDRLLALKSQR